MQLTKSHMVMIALGAVAAGAAYYAYTLKNALANEEALSQNLMDTAKDRGVDLTGIGTRMKTTWAL